MTNSCGPADQDPTHTSRLRPLRLLLQAMDDDIAQLYAERGVIGVRPRFSMALIRLHHLGPMSVSDLATEVAVSHSAMSQTVTAMRRHDLVRTGPGADARTRVVSLTDQGQELVPWLEHEWRATEQAVAQLEAELPYPLTRVVQDLQAALDRYPFHDRVAAQLDAGAAGC